MKHIPILFQKEMVQAIENYCKTKTRRDRGLKLFNKNPDDWEYEQLAGHFLKNKKTGEVKLIDSPYGEVGDILWVRENHRALVECGTGKFARWDYQADMPDEYHKQHPHKWKPSIHMPKKACRIFLKVKSVKIERIQSITELDALNEGVTGVLTDEETQRLDNLKLWKLPLPTNRHILSFLALWCYINGYPTWVKNIFVWVIEFEKTTQPENFLNE